MSGSVIHSQSAAMVPAVYSAGQSAQLPVAIDYPAALALRQMSMVHDELPKYLLAPEVSALLHYVPDLRRKMLLATLWNTGARINEALALTRGDFSLTPPYPFVQLATLWNTGARINEALALTRGDFSLTPPYPFVQLATLKQRTEKAARRAGRMPAGQQTHRLVPLSDAWYVSQLQTMVATLKIPMERRNKRTGRTEKARIWEVTDRTVRTWIGEAVAAAAADGVTFSVPVTPHTFRHSYAMHMLYAGIPLKVLQSLMGHKSISSTEVYTKVFALDVAARHRVQFAMPESDAVTMLKNRHV
ncbi:phage integrase family protein [Escherichia coli]|nr:phage integrase family protein [Escherichia coli]